MDGKGTQHDKPMCKTTVTIDGTHKNAISDSLGSSMQQSWVSASLGRNRTLQRTPRTRDVNSERDGVRLTDEKLSGSRTTHDVTKNDGN